MIKSQKLKGGKGDKLSPADVDAGELALGIQVEMEHTRNEAEAKEIALDHLSEDREYYTKLRDAGLADELEKSLFLENLQKAKSYPIGTVRVWDGVKYKKAPDGKWKPEGGSGDHKTDFDAETKDWMDERTAGEPDVVDVGGVELNRKDRAALKDALEGKDSIPKQQANAGVDDRDDYSSAKLSGAPGHGADRIVATMSKLPEGTSPLMFFEKAKKNNTPENTDVAAVIRDIMENHNRVLDNYEQRTGVGHAGLVNRMLNNFSKIQEATVNQAIAIRVDVDGLMGIVKDRVLKNQWETGTSNGSLSTAFRTRWEEKIVQNGSGEEFDHEVYQTKVPSQLKPVYGYIPIAGVSDNSVRHYGDIKIVLKPEVSDRATFTVGDSSMSQGAFVKGGVTKLLDVKNEFRKGLMFDNLTEAGSVLDGYSYLEAQVFGGINIDTDVQEIVVTARVVEDIEKFRKASGLEAAGVKVRYWGEEDD